MRKLLFIFCFIVLLNTLYAKRLYLDFGVGESYVRTSYLGCEGFMLNIWQPFVYHETPQREVLNTLSPNFNLKLGYKLYDNFILGFDLQSLFLREELYYSYKATENNSSVKSFDYKEYVSGLYMGFGIVYYIYPRTQLGFSMGSTFLIRDVFYDIKREYQTHKDYISFAQFTGIGGAYEISMAYEVPVSFIDFLLGAKFFYSSGSSFMDIDLSDDYRVVSDWNVVSIGVFTKIKF